MHEGTAEAIIGGDVLRTIPALRAVRFPYFEGTVEALGGHVDGLAGQSVFGFRRIVVDPPRGVIHLEPRRLRAR